MDKHSYFQRLQRYWIFTIPSLLLACAPILDVKPVSQKIQREFQKKTEIAVHSVKCPQDVESKTGENFFCDIYALDGSVVKTKVTLTDDQGHFTWSVREGLVNLAVIEKNIEQTFKDQRLSNVRAFCEGKYKIAHQGEIFECQVQESDDLQGTVQVKVTDKQGKVNFQVLDQ